MMTATTQLFLGKRRLLGFLLLFCSPILSASFGFSQMRNELRGEKRTMGAFAVPGRLTNLGRTEASTSKLFVREGHGDAEGNEHSPVSRSGMQARRSSMLSEVKSKARRSARAAIITAGVLAVSAQINPQSAVAAVFGPASDASSSILRLAVGTKGGAVAFAGKRASILALKAGAVVIGALGVGKLLRSAFRARSEKLEEERVDLARQQPKSDEDEQELAEKYGAMDLEDRALSILLDLGMVEKTPDP